MRVIVVTSWFLSLQRPFLSPYLREFIQRLERAGVDISVYAPRAEVERSSLEMRSVRFYSAIGPFGLARFLGEAFTNPRAVVHIQRPNTYASVFILAARLLGRPVVATIHRAEVLPYHPLPWGAIRRVVLKMLDIAICVSESTRSLAIDCGSSPENTMVIYNTLTGDRFTPRSKEEARRSLGLPLKGNVILYLGDFRKEKGCATLLQAFAGLPAPVILVLVGDGPLRGELMRLAVYLGVSERTLFQGRVAHDSDRLPLFYNAADVFVLPSLTEGHSMALLEAMASGLAIVASRVGGNEETIEPGKDGYLVESGNPEAFRDAIAALLRSPSLRAEVATAARESFLREFSERTNLEETLRTYNKLVSSKYKG